MKFECHRYLSLLSVGFGLGRCRMRTIEADGLVLAALRSGLRQPDGIHMTAEGHRRVAQEIAAQIP